MFAYLLLDVLELLNVPKEDRDKEILQWHSIPEFFHFKQRQLFTGSSNSAHATLP